MTACALLYRSFVAIADEVKSATLIQEVCEVHEEMGKIKGSPAYTAVLTPQAV